MKVKKKVTGFNNKIGLIVFSIRKISAAIFIFLKIDPLSISLSFELQVLSFELHVTKNPKLKTYRLSSRIILKENKTHFAFFCFKSLQT